MSEQEAANAAPRSDVRAGVPAVALLLYRKQTRLIATTLLHAVNEATAELGETFELVEAMDDRRFALAGHTHHIVVEDSAEPLGKDALASALAHPFVDTVFPAARAIALGHGAHTRITVAAGPVPANDAALDMDALELADFEPENVLPRLRLLRAATHAFTRQRFPLAVHWCQSDNLLAGPEFVQMAERGVETELFVKAVPYCESGDDGNLYGAVTSGAANVIGREVELAGAPVQPAWAADRLLQFVEKARTGVPAAGEALRFPTDEIVLVHDEPASPVFPAGHVKLTVEKLPPSATSGDGAAPDGATIGFLNEMEKRAAGRAFGRR